MLLQLTSDATPAHWPLSDNGSLGRVLAPGAGPSNAAWTCSRCDQCGDHSITLRATTPLRSGDAICAPPPPLTFTIGSGHLPALQLSVDGGARAGRNGNPAHGDIKWVGAGAAIWGPPRHDGTRPCWAQACLADPRRHDSMDAEAAGLRLGFAIIVALFTHPVSLHIVGDNLPILRMAAANGRLRADRVWHTLERPIMHALAQGWRCDWSAVRRHRNKTADHLATRGTLSAVGMGTSGAATPHAWLWVSPDAAVRPAAAEGGALPWHADLPVHRAHDPLCPLDLRR